MHFVPARIVYYLRFFPDISVHTMRGSRLVLIAAFEPRR